MGKFFETLAEELVGALAVLAFLIVFVFFPMFLLNKLEDEWQLVIIATVFLTVFIGWKK